MSRLRWPVPALLAWGVAWVVYWVSWQAGLSSAYALLVASLASIVLSLAAQSWWRKVIMAAGFPLALLASGAAVLPPWGWLVLLGLLAMLYPVQAWRDAPLFPTPAGALRSLAPNAPLPVGALVLDAGCGLGDGLLALRAAYPDAQLHGIERSWPLGCLCALRCPWARVRQGDIWRANWSPYALVYVFQRPESMLRALEKAGAELRPGSWLVSLEFEASALAPTKMLTLSD